MDIGNKVWDKGAFSQYVTIDNTVSWKGDCAFTTLDTVNAGVGRHMTRQASRLKKLGQEEGSMRVLMIEDDHDVSTLISHFVEVSFHGEASVEIAEDLNRADACLRECVYDLILLDVHLPDGHGLHWLRNQDAIVQQQVPVIVLSADVEAEKLLESIDMGSACFLGKALHSYVALPDIIDDCIEARFAKRELANAINEPHVA